MIAGITRQLANARKMKPKHTPDAQMELVEHLAELRTRLFRAVLYLGVGMLAAYYLYDSIFELFTFPIAPILEKTDSLLAFPSVADPFLLRMQVCFIGGITTAFPFITLELWGFIAPALTLEERKPVIFLAPFSVLLFIAGVATGYASLPTCYQWMASFISDVPGGVLYQNPRDYILLTAKIMLAFGISFELPVVLLFLARIGLITAELMTTYWRHAVVIISAAAAILTPSTDPLTMLMMAVPMAGLYLLSIVLVRAFQPKEGEEAKSLAAMLAIALVPVVITGAAGFWIWRMHMVTPYSVLHPPRRQELQQAIVNNQKASQKAEGDLQSQLAQVLSRMDSMEKENATLKQRVEELEAQKAGAPAATPVPDSTPEPNRTPFPDSRTDAAP
jgi:sec-independent protein translocase protein TatC